MATGIARSVTGAPDGYRDMIKLQFNPKIKYLKLENQIRSKEIENIKRY